jgi:ATP-binding cassette subfamily B protein
MYTDRKHFKWWKSTTADRRWSAYYDAMLTHGNAATEMRLYGLSAHFRMLYQVLRGNLRDQKLFRLRKQSYGKVIANTFALAAAGTAFVWMAFRVLYNLATLGDLGVFYQIFSRGQGITSALLQSIGKIFDNSLYLENLFIFLDHEARVVSPVDPHPPLATLSRGIAFKSVSFEYPGSSIPAMSDLDLFVPAGNVVALVGVNGAGKTTLIKLLSRLYDPTEGSIEIDGIDVRRFDIEELRKMMSVLSQFPMQYQALARENIALGDLAAEAGLDAVAAAAKRAGAHKFISDLPKQYDTLLGKWFVNGTELSGGEWQRLALARAYFRQAPIIVLDEPTTFMDSWSEADWFDRFRQMAVGNTALLITHRLTIAMRADVIHVIDDGKIIESGSHQELLECDGPYARSWKEQMRSTSENVLPTADTFTGNGTDHRQLAKLN